MTIDNIVFKIVVPPDSAEKYISLLRGNIDSLDIDLNRAYTLPVNEILTREQKDKYISELKDTRLYCQDWLKQALDSYYAGKRGFKGGRHNIEREGDYLSKDG